MPLGDGRFQIGDVERKRAAFVEQHFHAPGVFGQRAAAIGRFELDAVVARRIVAGGDHHAADRAFVFHGKRDHRRRRIGVSQMHDQVVAGQHARHFHRVAIAQEARVKAHHGLRARAADLDEVFGNGLRHAAHIVKREVFADDGPPAVGAKMNCQMNPPITCHILRRPG